MLMNSIKEIVLYVQYTAGKNRKISIFILSFLNKKKTSKNEKQH